MHIFLGIQEFVQKKIRLLQRQAYEPTKCLKKGGMFLFNPLLPVAVFLIYDDPNCWEVVISASLQHFWIDTD